MRIWMVILVWLLISCNEIRDCALSSNRDGAVIAFYEVDSVEKYRKGTFYLIRPDGELDTVRPVSNFTARVAELNPADSAVNYLFRVLDSTQAPDFYADYRLTMSYQKSLEIYYDECEPIFRYELDSAYSPDFDSVALIANPLDKQIGVNVEIYF